MQQFIVAAAAMLFVAACAAAERQREFTNADIERVVRENPGLAAQPAPMRSSTIYRCKKISGQVLWADAPCHTIDASTTDVFYVPAHPNFNERVRSAEAEFLRRYPPASNAPSGPTAQERFDECLELNRRLAELWRRNRQSYPQLSIPLKARQKQIGCD